MSTYAATQVGRYLQERFGFTFLEKEPYRRLEDHIWEAGRRAQLQRREVVATCRALADDIGYVLTSAEKLDRSPYQPNQRGDFASAVTNCIELEREVQDLIGVHEATVAAVRLLLSNTPTLEEHSQALGELREVKQHLIGARQEVTNLLEAREQWKRDEEQLRGNRAQLADRVKELEAMYASAAREASTLGTTRALRNKLTAEVAELRQKLEAEAKAAQDFHDERDQAAREASIARDNLALSEEKVQQYRREIERLEDKADQLAADLAKANDPGELGR